MKSNLAGIIVAFSLVAPTFCQAQIILSHLRRRADFFSTGSLLSNRLTPLFAGGPLVVTAADVGKFLKVRWNFTTDIVIQGQGENDYGFITINGNANFFKLADMHDSRLHDSTFFLQGFPSETGWQSFSFRVDTATSYTLGI